MNRAHTLALTLALTLTVAACTSSAKKVGAQTKSTPTPKTQPVSAPTGVLDLTGMLDKDKRVELTLSPPTIKRPCHKTFEPHARPLEQWPFDSPAREDVELFGCDREAFLKTAQGERVIAYTLPSSEGTSPDMRTLMYGPSGKLLWSHRTARKGENFTLNFRESYILDLAPHLMCSGTLWESSVQLHCMNRASGEDTWLGRLPFWSGIVPQRVDMSVVIADISAIRRHYPYNGLEQRYKRLPASGGRMALYATDGDKLFFGANRTPDLTLQAYDLKSFELLWSVAVEDEVDAVYTKILPNSELLVLQREGTLDFFNTKTGERLYRLKSNEDSSPLASWKDQVLMLQRRGAAPNRLIALDAKTGELAWWAITQTGTLKMDATSTQVMLSGVTDAYTIQSGPTP